MAMIIFLFCERVFIALKKSSIISSKLRVTTIGLIEYSSVFGSIVGSTLTIIRDALDVITKIRI